ncbi:hypothetical protein D3C78_975150 [compost metagenome]
MANFTLEQLLKYPPFDALLIAYNDVKGTQLNPRFVELAQVINSNGADLTIRIKARDSLPNSDENRFKGQGDITVKRIDLGALFNTPFAVPFSGEILSHDVANVISQKTGIVFDKSDFDSVVFNQSTFTLQAAANSLRWYGQMTIQKA